MYASPKDVAQTTDLLDVLKVPSKCERVANELTNSDLILSIYFYMLTITLLHNSTENGDITKVLEHLFWI